MSLSLGEYSELKRKYGEGAYIVNKNNFHMIDVYSSGIPSLDAALGIGGYPKGHFVEIFGDEGTGKTMVGLQAIREAQIRDKKSVSAIIDSDHALDIDFVQSIGINTENLILQQPSTAEEALESVLILLESEAIDIIFVDSIPSLLPKNEIGIGFEDIDVYEHSKLLNNFLDKAYKQIRGSNSIVIFSNQTRSGMGSSKDRTVGGKRLTYYNTIRVKLDLAKPILKNNVICGHEIAASVIVNKITNKMDFAYFDIHFQKGIDKVKSLILEMLRLNIVLRINNGFWYQGTHCGDSARELVRTINKDNYMRSMMEKDLYDKILEISNI